MACPSKRAAAAEGEIGWPAATRSCSRTRSTPVTSSVTGCSTWRRVLTSRKKKSRVASSTRNSTVPVDVYPMARASERAASPMAARIASSTTGDGDSSTTFW